MKIFGIEFNFGKKEQEVITETKNADINALMDGYSSSGGTWSAIYGDIFNGEKNQGEGGPIFKATIDHVALSQRAWDLDLKSETCHTIIKQKGKWLLGTGLVLECEPKIDVLKLFGINLTVDFAEEFTKRVEALWEVHAYKTTLMDYANRVSLHKIAKRVEKNAAVKGDVLVIHRINKNNIITTQLIDGQHVQTPLGLVQIANADKMVDNYIGYEYQWTNGNRIRNGVEISDTGEHVAYHVRDGLSLEYKRIAARNSKGLLVAYLVYSSEYRLDNSRGVPITTPVMESAKQLDEYTSATVAKAVEVAKVAYYITHEKGTGEVDIRDSNLAKIIGTGGNPDLPRDVNGIQLANKVQVTTNKTTYNTPEGTAIETLSNDKELDPYKDFHKTRFDSECATAGIPPEVASQLYGGSYSASRAATNGWQYMLNIDRDDFGDQFYQRVYNLQLLVWVMAGLIDAPGYIDAFRNDNQIVLAAYNFAQWTGAPVPQIDQWKEIKAIREALGKGSEHMPLATFGKMARNLGNGSWDAILSQYAREMDESDDLGIEHEDKLTGAEEEGNETKSGQPTEGSPIDDKKQKRK